MNNPRLVSTLYRVYVPTSMCTKSKKSKKSIDLVIPHYIAPYSLAANIHICRAESKQAVTDDMDKISRLPRQDEKQHSGSHISVFADFANLFRCRNQRHGYGLLRRIRL